MNISEPGASSTTTHSLWQLPFRSFFLVAGLFSSSALMLWLGHLTGTIILPVGKLSPLLWHIHEMVFGFGVLVAVGFVLTAVQTWTGQKSISGAPVVALLSIWLCSRVALISNDSMSLILAMVLQVVWWMAVITVYTKIVIRAQNRRNYLFIPIFVVIAVLNLAYLAAVALQKPALALHMGKSAILVFTILMSIVGGRVIPFFTVRGANTESISPMSWLERVLPIVAIVGVGVFITGFFFELPFTPAAFMIFAGSLHLIRLANWRTRQTFNVPLLWSLHLSYLFMALGLIFLGASYLVDSVAFSSSLHVITIGGMGLMIFSMMSRVGLGHTGRRLEVSKWTFLALWLIVLATLSRFVFVQVGQPQLAWILSALMWSLAGLLFVLVYTPILTKPKLS